MLRTKLISIVAPLALLAATNVAQANPAQEHFLNAGINMGWAAAEIQLRGFTSAATNALTTAAGHIQAGEALIGEPHASNVGRRKTIARVVKDLRSLGARFRKKPVALKTAALWVYDLYNSYRGTLRLTYDSRIRSKPWQARSTCDGAFSRVGFGFGLAHVAAGVQSGKQRGIARRIQNLGNGIVRSGISTGQAAALDGTPRTKTTAKKLCCSFGNTKAWSFVPKLAKTTPSPVYDALLSKLQRRARRAGGLAPSSCGGAGSSASTHARKPHTTGPKHEPNPPKPRRAYQGIVGTWRWFKGPDVTFMAGGRCKHPRLTCTWKKRGDTFVITWSHGYTDKLALSDNGTVLRGFGSKSPSATRGHEVSATRRR